MKADAIASRSNLITTEAGDCDPLTERGFAPVLEGFEPISRTTTFDYDAHGRMTRLDGPRTDVKDWTEIEYDDLGRAIACEGGGKEEGSWRMTTSADPISHRAHQLAQISSSQYDSRGRVHRGRRDALARRT